MEGSYAGVFECIKECEGIPPVTNGNSPYACYDSPYRIKDWVKHRINTLDIYFEYNTIK